MQDITSLPYHTVPRNKLQHKQLTNWSRNDIWCVIITFLIVVAGFVRLHIVFALLLALMVLPLNARITYARMYSEIATEFKGMIIEHLLGGYLWQADNQSSRFKRMLRRMVVKHPIPLRMGTVEAIIEGSVERYSVLHQLDRKFDHLYIAADGGDFSSFDVSRMHAAVDELANTTNQIIVQTDLNVGISYLRITGPADFTAVARYLSTDGNPVVFNPDQFDVDDGTRAWAGWLRENASQLRPSAQQFGVAKTWFLVVVTIKRSSEWRQANMGKLNDQELYDLPIVELGRNMVDALRSSNLLGLKNVRCLSLAELSSVIRSSWDVSTIDDYYGRRAEGSIPKNDAQIDAAIAQQGETAIDAILDAWPKQQIKAGRDYLQVDDSFISTLRVIAWPEEVRVDQVLSLHYRPKLGRWTRMAMTGQSISGDAETRQMIIAESALVNVQNALFSNRVVQNPKWGKKRRELSQQSQQLSANSVGQHFNFLYPVVASSLSELRQATKEVMGALNANGFRSVVVLGSGRQRDAAISGILGANRL